MGPHSAQKSLKRTQQAKLHSLIDQGPANTHTNIKEYSPETGFGFYRRLPAAWPPPTTVLPWVLAVFFDDPSGFFTRPARAGDPAPGRPDLLPPWGLIRPRFVVSFIDLTGRPAGFSKSRNLNIGAKVSYNLVNCN